MTHQRKDQVCIITLNGELEWEGINDIRQYLLDCLEGKDVDFTLLNCQNIQGLESKGGVLITTLYQTVIEKNKKLGLFQVSDSDQEGLKKFNLDQMVKIFESKEEAFLEWGSAEGLSEQEIQKEFSQEEPPDNDSFFDANQYHPILQLTVDYFQELDDQILSTQNPLIEARDGCLFDANSIQEALTMCEHLQLYLEQLSDEKLKTLQLIFPFYKTPERLLNKFQICFMGDMEVKEKIIRIYTTKAFGSYKIALNIISCSALFEGMESEASKKIKFALWKHTESTFKRVKEIIPIKSRAKMKWTPQTTASNIKKYLAQGAPFFEQNSDYQQVAQKYREIIFNIFAHPNMEFYLEWKNNYLKYWLHEELFFQDIFYLENEKKQLPRFMPVKLKIYQNLATIFSTLEPEDRPFDKSLLLRKTELAMLNRGEAYLSTTTEPLKYALNKARHKEKTLLDSLTINQLSTVAEWVHKEILTLKRNQGEDQDEIASLNTRHTDIASEQKAEQTYTSKAIEAQIEHSEKVMETAGKVMSALKQIKNKFLSGLRKKEPVKEEEPVVAGPKVPARIQEPQSLLEKANVDWVGFGKEFKSTVYENKLPSLQKLYFSHGELKIALWEDYKIAVKAIVDFYGKQGYLQQKTFKVGVTISGKNVIKHFEDSAVYLKSSNDTVLVLGYAPFSKTSDPVYYFQLYRTNVSKPYTGTTKNIDYSRKIDGVKYDLENYEKAHLVRPILFLNLIYAIDSLPDEIRNEHHHLLSGLHETLHILKSPPNRREN